jgi:hypothetical protein
MFNKAFAAFKLNDQDPQVRGTWEDLSSSSSETCIRLLAHINLAIISCYQDLASIGVNATNSDFEKLVACGTHMDEAFQTLAKMALSRVDPRNAGALPVPSWLNFDVLLSQCRKIQLRVKACFERLPHHTSTVDQLEFELVKDLDEIKRQTQRQWLAHIIAQHEAFIKGLAAAREHPRTSSRLSTHPNIDVSDASYLVEAPDEIRLKRPLDPDNPTPQQIRGL